MKRPASGEKNLERIQRRGARCVLNCGAQHLLYAAALPGETEEANLSTCWRFVCEAQIDRAAALRTAPVDGAWLPTRSWNVLTWFARSAGALSRRSQPSQPAGAAAPHRCDHAGAGRLRAGLGPKAGVSVSYADAPEIDGNLARLLPPEKLGTLKVGEFTRASSTRISTIWWLLPCERLAAAKPSSPTDAREVRD